MFDLRSMDDYTAHHLTGAHNLPMEFIESNLHRLPFSGDLLFYDGGCGLCHRWVRFVLWADRGGVFRFAPLGGETFRSRVREDEREGLPDSLVLLTPDGSLRTRSAALPKAPTMSSISPTPSGRGVTWFAGHGTSEAETR